MTATTEQWIEKRIKQDEYLKYMDQGKDFIDENAIFQALEKGKNPDPKRIDEILQKSLAIQTLTPEETSALIHVEDEGVLEKMRATALEVKKKVYDNRIVTFAPLYMSTYCVNDCVYCGFRKSNKAMERGALTMEEVRAATHYLAGQIGHKRLIVVYGEDPRTDTDYIAETIQTVYSVSAKTPKGGVGQIRRVNVNAAPLPIEDLKRLNSVGIGTYQVFQETYHHDTFNRLHPKKTLKNNYPWRLYSMHRALEAGIDDVGIGALFGLYDWKFEIMGLLSHSIELEKKMGIGPHTISFPRLEPASHAPFIEKTPHKMSDRNFLKALSIIRLSVPYVGMIITARETADIRRQAIQYGVTQADASSKLGLGAYSRCDENQNADDQQFILGDTRTLDELIRELAQMGNITSFCTAGYRSGRTGKCIMELLRCGREGQFCKLNAVLTFKEWLEDFASEETKKIGETILQKEIEEVKAKLPSLYPAFYKSYEKICSGERDIYY